MTFLSVDPHARRIELTPLDDFEQGLGILGRNHEQRPCDT
jgi:hypothetical protein